MCAVNFSFIKVVTLPLNDLFLFCWSTLGALATEFKDLFYDCEDVLDLILGWGGGGWRWEFYFPEADEDRGGGGGGVFSFLRADEDGVGRGGIEGDLCLLRGDGKGWGGEWSLLGDGEWSSWVGEDSQSSSSSEDNWWSSLMKRLRQATWEPLFWPSFGLSSTTGYSMGILLNFLSNILSMVTRAYLVELGGH